MKKGSPSSPEGLWLIDKPSGMTSFGVVARLRRLTGIKKVGHAGTLDPLATGLMLVLVGKQYTRQADQLIKLDKDYDMAVTLGSYSTTDDREGELSHISDRVPTKQEILTVIKSLTGTIQQKPPAYSAIKIGGKRAYKLARSGEVVDIPARSVTVHDWTVSSYEYPLIQAHTAVSSGTYIRSLAHDLGDKLGTGAYLTDLRRTRIGEYLLADALPLEELMKTLDLSGQI